MRQHMLDVIGERPDLVLPDNVDRAGGDHLVVVVDELQERFLDVARTRLDQDVAAPYLLVERHFFEHGQDLFAQGAAQNVVEIFQGARPRSLIAVLQRPARGADVLPFDTINARSRKIRSTILSIF